MSPEGARAANGSSPHQRSSPGALRGGTSALGGTSTRNFRLLSAAIVAVLLWETAERTLRAGPWRHQLLRRVVLPDRWALAGLDNGSKALAANITTGIIAAAQQLQQIQQQQEAEEAVRKREEEFAARQQRVNECRGWQGANTGLDGADEGWRWLAGLRAGVLDAASGAASDARDKGGNALKQAVASRLAQLIKNRSVTRAAVCDAALIAPKGALLAGEAAPARPLAAVAGGRRGAAAPPARGRVWVLPGPRRAPQAGLHSGQRDLLVRAAAPVQHPHPQPPQLRPGL